MPIVEPTLPASASYPTTGGNVEMAAAKALFESLLTAEGWEDMGERDEVQLTRLVDPLDAYAVPTVKGEATVQGITSDEFLAVIQLPGMRHRWDARFETGFILERFSRQDYSFYSEMKGLSWLVYPRDIAGQQHNYISATGEANQEIVVIQTSIEHELAPEQSGKTRATLSVSGWQLLPQADGSLKVTYIVKIALNGSMPTALVSMIATETPLCTGRARDAFYAVGHPPYVHPSVNVAETSVVFQTEHFSNPGATPDDKGPLEFTIAFTSNPSATFDLIYDTKKMYPDGIVVRVDGSGVEAIDDGAGKVTVTCTGDNKENVTVVLGPKLS